MTCGLPFTGRWRLHLQCRCHFHQLRDLLEHSSRCECPKVSSTRWGTSDLRFDSQLCPYLHWASSVWSTHQRDLNATPSTRWDAVLTRFALDSRSLACSLALSLSSPLLALLSATDHCADMLCATKPRDVACVNRALEPNRADVCVSVTDYLHVLCI